MRHFELNTQNLVRQDNTSVTLQGSTNEKLRGVTIKVEYRLHKEELRNVDDPEGSGDVMWCLHLPQINQAYVDKSEENVFEALKEFFEEDFIRHYATKLVEQREKDIELTEEERARRKARDE